MRILLSESTYTLLLENRIPFLQKKYVDSGLITLDVFNKLESADPTKNKEYVEWLCQIWLYGNLKLEDLYKATEYLALYSKVKHKLKGDEKNIYSAVQSTEKYIDTFNGKSQEKTRKVSKLKINSLQQLYQLIKPFENKPVTNSEKAKDVKKDAKKVYEDDTWVVVVPQTKEASCYYGAGTQWCTAAKEYNYFDSYNKEGKLYININKKTKKKFQFHVESSQFMDETDSQIDLRDFFKGNVELKKFYYTEWRTTVYEKHDIKHDGEICYKLVKDYDYFTDNFEKSVRKFVHDIFGGDGHQYFEFSYYEYEDFMFNYINDENKKRLIEVLKNENEWDEDEDLETNLKTSDGHTKEVVVNAYSNAAESEAQNEAYNHILKQIKNHFGFKSMDWVGETLKCVYQTCPDVLDLIVEDQEEEYISLNEPYSGFGGNINEEYFNQLISEEL